MHRTFFAGYSQLPWQVQGLRGAPEWPPIQTMLPDFLGKRRRSRSRVWPGIPLDCANKGAPSVLDSIFAEAAPNAARTVNTLIEAGFQYAPTPDQIRRSRHSPGSSSGK
jgi:hypothetical protein